MTDATSNVKYIKNVKILDEVRQLIDVDGQTCGFGVAVWIIPKDRSHRPSTTSLIKFASYSAAASADGDENFFDAVLDLNLTDDERRLLAEPVAAMGAVIVGNEYMHRGEFRDFEGNTFVVQQKLPQLHEIERNVGYTVTDEDRRAAAGDALAAAIEGSDAQAPAEAPAAQEEPANTSGDPA